MIDVVLPCRDEAAALPWVLGRRCPTGPGAWRPLLARWRNAVLASRLCRTAGRWVHDVGPMRAARREALLALGIQDRCFGHPLEMVVLAGKAGWRVPQVDVDYLPQAQRTRSKVTGTVLGTVHAARDMSKVLAS